MIARYGYRSIIIHNCLCLLSAPETTNCTKMDFQFQQIILNQAAVALLTYHRCR